MEPPPIALIVALAQERRALRRCLTAVQGWRTEEGHGVAGRLSREPILLIQAGIGCDRARRALLSASRKFSIRGAWSLGFAGGLADSLRPGDLVCPGVVIRDDGQTGRAFAAPPAHVAIAAALSVDRIPIVDGPLLSVDSPLRTPEAKRAAHGRTGAVGVDMEAAGVAEAAESLGIPWLAIKAVVDTVDEPLPCFLSGCTTPRGDLRWRSLFLSLTRPSRRRALRQLAQASGMAAQALQWGLKVAVPAWSP
jgi:adenosylhomocysteine nucleosidase